MRLEGRYGEFKELLRYYRDLGTSYNKAVYSTMRRMGYKGPLLERRLAAEIAASYACPQMRAERDLLMQECRNDQNQKDFSIPVDVSENQEPGDLPPDVSWVWHNLHRAEGEMHNWTIFPDQAPSPGAWNMLVWASQTKTKFMEFVLREKIRAHAQTEDEEDLTIGDDGRSMEELDLMLKELEDAS